jgi:DNA-binding transcriptional LysR family regulator
MAVIVAPWYYSEKMNVPRPLISDSDIADRLSLRDLATFLAVAEHGGVTRAARALGYAQSTVSLHVQSLEAALGIPLFRRAGKRLVLEPAGQRLAAEGADLLAHARRLYDQATPEKGVTPLFLSSIEPFGSRQLPAFIVAYRREHPEIEINVQVIGSVAAFELLQAERIALAIGARPMRAEPAFPFTPLYEEPLVALVPRRHRLASAKSVRLTDLSGERVIVSDESCVFRRLLQHAVDNGGFDLALSATFGAVTSIPFAVAAGMGVAVLPRGLVTPEPTGVRAIPITHPPLTITVGIALPRNPSPAAADFAAFLRHSMRATT